MTNCDGDDDDDRGSSCNDDVPFRGIGGGDADDDTAVVADGEYSGDKLRLANTNCDVLGVVIVVVAKIAVEW